MTSFPCFPRRLWLGLLLGAPLGAGALSACGGGTSPQQPSPTPGATPASTPVVIATPPANGTQMLVFAMAPEGSEAAQTDIFSARPDGSNLRRLTQSAPDSAGNVQPQGSPALSPDRRQIVYVAVSFQNNASQSQLRIMNADGSNSRVLTSDAGAQGATTPTWNPGGTRIAFSRGNDGIFVVDANGSNLRRLTDRGANPSWSISNRIAFNAAPGVRATALQTTKNSAALKPSFQPSGVLPPSTGFYTDIFTIGADGSGLRQITRQDQSATGLASINPSWSPDGQTLVFNSVPGSGVPATLFLIGADGTNRRALGSVNGTDAVFSPDGGRIAYSDEIGLSIVDLNGANRVTPGGADALFVEDTDWR